MGERGTFTTNFMYCPDCAELLRGAVQGRPGWTLAQGVGPSVVQGLIKGFSGGEEVLMAKGLLREIRGQMCDGCTITLFVFCDDARLGPPTMLVARAPDYLAEAQVQHTEECF